MPARALLLALVLLTMVATGCTGGGSDPESEPVPPGAPEPFRASSAPPAGWQLTQCSDFRAQDNSGLAVRVGVPPTFSGMTRTKTGCATGSSFDRSMRLTLDPGKTLLTYKETEVDPYVGSDQGDAEHGEVSYTPDVAAFGDVRGERLEYFCFCDGQNLAYRVVQANGVRLEWITPHRRSVHEGVYSAVTDSLALLRSDTSFCSPRGSDRTASFVPPVPQTNYIDTYGGACRLSLRSRGVDGYAEVAPDPSQTLAQVAAALGRDRHVTSARVDGDRLTWTTHQYRHDWRGVTWASPGLQVTWWDRPRTWRREADTIRAFTRSVRLLPRRQPISRRTPRAARPWWRRPRRSARPARPPADRAGATPYA